MESPAPMTPRSYTSATQQYSSPPTRPRSLFGASGSYSSRVSNASNKSIPRLFAQREKGMLHEDLADSVRETSWDTSMHLVRRQQTWNSQANGCQVAWRTQTSCTLPPSTRPPLHLPFPCP